MNKRLYSDSNVSSISGVGATREKQLLKLGINTVKDLLYYFPRAYEMRGNVKLLSKIGFDSPESVILTVAGEVKSAAIKRGLTISKFRAFDESGACEIVFFNSPFVKDVFHTGASFRFYGKATLSKSHIQFTNPKYEPILPDKNLPSLIPIYPLTEGISSKFIDKITKIALDEALSEISDPLPDDVRIENSLPVLSYAIRNVHFPESDEALKKSLARLAFDEMFLFGVGISVSKQFRKMTSGVRFSPCDLTPITSLLPYELTGDQKNAINDIYKDTVFKDEKGAVRPMSRILIGDVGSGKTICAVMAMYIAACSGYQSALMAPTEILARQHYGDVSKIFEKVNIKTALLLGSTSQKEKRKIYDELAKGKIQAIIGTHALISDGVTFANLGLVITDEQHRFGVRQRASLKDKASSSHLLVMSATPIPRTLALSMYGDLDISRIKEMPKGRTKVDTFVVDESYRSRLFAFIEKQVENGGQCYVVCPAIENEESTDNLIIQPASFFGEDAYSHVNTKCKNVIDYTENIRQKLPNLRIEYIHGKMKSSEKEAVMTAFASGSVDVLVSTTVIEVGVNVPNATLMVIEDADRFGLAQLHQLRGRVGRGEKKSYCVLVSSINSEKAKTRLQIMRTTYDGYEIAEKDLILRGPGDFLASASTESMRQSGGFEFKVAKLCDNAGLFEKAFSYAKKTVEKDPGLILPENEALRRELSVTLTINTATLS